MEFIPECQKQWGTPPVDHCWVPHPAIPSKNSLCLPHPPKWQHSKQKQSMLPSAYNCQEKNLQTGKYRIYMQFFVTGTFMRQQDKTPWWKIHFIVDVLFKVAPLLNTQNMFGDCHGNWKGQITLQDDINFRPILCPWLVQFVPEYMTRWCIDVCTKCSVIGHLWNN